MKNNQSELIDWKELRDKFFKECTEKSEYYPEFGDMPKVNMAPHDLFEWFKAAIQRAVATPAQDVRDEENDFVAISKKELDRIKQCSEARKNEIARLREELMRKDLVASSSASNEASVASHSSWLSNSIEQMNEEQLFSLYNDIKQMVGELGYNNFIGSLEVDSYRKWLREDKYKHRID